ncbi:hypothetical protein ANCCEY_08924 [Ancylostoma ceylanicum]|uniref:7TM GPCR serpentine receptor class x (Srx) domain-containing protein n=1 Tax=Ancylostoma ceylanicum TaxID=53326 RepID=A0A0D6LLC0_9BILA|nr:hypothetical protein ANCCEY_08924 [Ancylostoma ceylanicum]
MEESTAIPLSPIIINQDYQLAALTVFMIAFLGTICNSLVAIFTLRLASLNNAFGRLTASQAAGEMILCGIFAFYYSPMLPQYFALDSLLMGVIYIIALPPPWNREYLSQKCQEQKRMFCEKPYLQTEFYCMPNTSGECNILYSDSAWVFVFRATEGCGIISSYFDFGQDLAVVVLISIIDTITIIRVRLTSAEIQRSGCRVTTSKRTRDVTFLKQMQIVPWSILTASVEGEKESELHEDANLSKKQGICITIKETAFSPTIITASKDIT